MPERESFLLNEDVNPNSKLETIEELRERLQNAEKEIARLRSREELLGKRLDAAEAWMRKEERNKVLSERDFGTFKMFVFMELQPFIDKVALQNGLTAPQLPYFMNAAGAPREPVPPRRDPPAGASGSQKPQHPLIRKQA